MKICMLATATVLVALLTSCSETPQQTEKKAAEPAKPPQPVAGKYALYQMYTAARGALGADIEPVQLKSIHLGDVKAEPGKAGAWQVTFSSARAQKARSYTYSVVESEGNLHKGVFAGLDETWTGGARGPKPFPMAAVKIDTDAAYETAKKKAVDYEKKNPDKTISFLLEKTEKYPDPTWRVIWGESIGTSNFSVLVDASTGDYLQTLH
jgi:hypothetical protein